MGRLSQRRTDPSSHKNYKDVPTLVTLPAAMTVHPREGPLTEGGVNLAHSLGVQSHHDGESMAAEHKAVSWSRGIHSQER